jgi:hypothetical protein
MEVRAAVVAAADVLGVWARVEGLAAAAPLAGAVFMAIADSGRGPPPAVAGHAGPGLRRRTRRRLVTAGLIPTAVYQTARARA